MLSGRLDAIRMEEHGRGIFRMGRLRRTVVVHAGQLQPRRGCDIVSVAVDPHGAPWSGI